VYEILPQFTCNPWQGANRGADEQKASKDFGFARLSYKGAHEYACECNADTRVIIRTQEDGKICYLYNGFVRKFSTYAQKNW
jgi:hypothetical protein